MEVKHSVDVSSRKREGETVDYTLDDLAEAKRQIDSLLHKLGETIRTLESKESPAKYKSQITLARRRVAALEIAGSLIEKEVMRRSAERVG